MNKNYLTEKNREIFHQEIGKIIYYFNEYIEILDFSADNLKILYRLIKKVLSNATSANILILEDCLEDSQIVLRSALESVVLITYLANFPEKIMDYLADSQILRIKNNFIAYKMTKEYDAVLPNGKIITENDMLEENEKWFNTILPIAQEKILKGIKEKIYKINDKTFYKIDKYFQTFKPSFMNLNKMFKELFSVDYKIKGQFDLREGIFPFYNESSQITHGCYFDWDFKRTFGDEAEHLFQFFNKTTLLLKCILDEVIKTNENTKAQNYLLEIKKSTDVLNELIYGKKYFS